MSFETLMKQLQDNASQTHKRRIESEQNRLQQSVQAQYSGSASPGPARRAKPGRQARGNNGTPHVKGKLSGFKGGLASPIKGMNMTSPYGMRTHPITGVHKLHSGVDYGAPSGTPIRAVATGRIRGVNANNGAWGNQLILKHGKGLSTMYAHLSKFNVKPGQKVKRGQIIGYVGSTGYSTGPHLHFEVWRKGQPVNPTKYI